MRAVVNTEYGPPEVLHVTEVDPPEPADDEVLVRVRATTVNRTDCAHRTPTPQFVRLFTGLRRPRRRVLGSEFAGEVVAVGSSVTEFAVGDEVFGVNAARVGAHAELVRVRERDPIAHKPAGLSFEEAAAVCDGFVLGMTCLRWAKLQEGQRILVYGASGSIGSAAVQLAKDRGAHVTAVCDTRGLEVVGSLDPDVLVDYTAEDVAATGETYDVVLDAVGKKTFGECAAMVADGGAFVTTDLGPRCRVLPQVIRTKFFGRKRVLMPLPAYRKGRVLELRELLEAGRYRAVIDRCYPLEEVVEATRYVESEQKLGNVVLTVA